MPAPPGAGRRRHCIPEAPASDAPADQAEVWAFLRALAGADPVQTHISAVFRGADTVWKLKKAVRLGFLDFTAPAERERFLRRELALNAPHAPGLYRDVVPVVRTPAGLALDGPGPVLDHVLRMAPVPEADFLDAMAASGRLDDDTLRAVADVVAAMHAGQAPVGDANPAGRLHDVLRGNLEAAGAAGLDPALVAGWGRALRDAINARGPLLAARGGLVRRAHGDLHAGNLLMWQGRPVPFDALEFDEALATIDPAYDLAFLLMDLERLAGRAAANLVMNRYLARTGDAGLVGVLPPFLSLRALIRAHVEAARGRDPAALVRAGLAALEPGRPAVVVLGGLMGTGKSTLARVVAPGLGGPPGALVLRSDELRKLAHGAAPEQRLGADAYTDAATARTEQVLLDAVRAAVRGGAIVVVDATCLQPGFRARLRDAAGSAPFHGFWLHAPLAELERRVRARRDDASDATVSVLRRAAADAAPPEGWEPVDATDAGAARDQVQERLAML